MARGVAPSALTEAEIKSIVTAVVDGVGADLGKRSAEEAVERYKQVARLETELATVRQTNAQQAAEITALRAYITRLNGFLATSAPASTPAFVPTPPVTTVTIPAAVPNQFVSPIIPSQNNNGAE